MKARTVLNAVAGMIGILDVHRRKATHYRRECTRLIQEGWTKDAQIDAHVARIENQREEIKKLRDLALVRVRELRGRLLSPSVIELVGGEAGDRGNCGAGPDLGERAVGERTGAGTG